MNKKQRIAMYGLEKKSPSAAALWSLLLVGGGQVYNEEAGKGIAMLVGCVILWFLLLGWILWIASPIEAYNTAKKHNKKLLLKYDLTTLDVM